MDKTRCGYFWSIALILIVLNRPNEARSHTLQNSDSVGRLINKLNPQRVPDAAAQIHIRQVIDSLAPDSLVRRTLEDGHFGTGIHEPWMDDMKRAGVKVTMFEVHGVWRVSTRFQPQTTKRLIYRKKYDGPGSQITDVRELARFQESGLQAKLQDAAFQEATKAFWIGDHVPEEGEACIVEIYLFDDEWVSRHTTNVPKISRYNPEEFPLGYAALAGDLATVQKQLAAQQFSRDQLNTALFAAVSFPSDNTDVISLLLRAGADVNASRRPNGTTALMDSVDTLTLSNIKLLLASSADVSRKTTDGWTAYSLAMQQMKQFRDQGKQPPDYMSEILELLKPSNGTSHTHGR